MIQLWHGGRVIGSNPWFFTIELQGVDAERIETTIGGALTDVGVSSGNATGVGVFRQTCSQGAAT